MHDTQTVTVQCTCFQGHETTGLIINCHTLTSTEWKWHKICSQHMHCPWTQTFSFRQWCKICVSYSILCPSFPAKYCKEWAPNIDRQIMQQDISAQKLWQLTIFSTDWRDLSFSSSPIKDTSWRKGQKKGTGHQLEPDLDLWRYFKKRHQLFTFAIPSPTISTCTIPLYSPRVSIKINYFPTVLETLPKSPSVTLCDEEHYEHSSKSFISEDRVTEKPVLAWKAGS